MPAPRTARSPSIWTMSTMRAASDLGVMSPKPTVEKTVTVKYRAPVRVSGWVKFAAELVPSRSTSRRTAAGRGERSTPVPRLPAEPGSVSQRFF
jgi:hypothetical protein